jgi:2-polyprenyl-6-methoxyphenol hydroxylase-like FAD-dependent oxidoreductase
MAQRYQVLIVGGGPVGMALAVSLGLRGVSCALIERHVQSQRIPKGQNLTHRTLEHFYFWGLVDELRAARVMPRGYPIGELTAYESLTSDYWHASAGRELVHSYFFQANERLPQYQMEGVLRKRMETLPSVDTRFGFTATAIEQDDGGVRVTIADRGGAVEVLEGDYLVGCDGGHSLVRDQTGITRGGTDFDQQMLLAVFRSRELHERLERFPQRSTYRVMHPDLKGYWQFFGRIDVGEGWFFHAPVPAGTKPDDRELKKLIERAAGFEFACEFDHLGFWDLRVAVADRYRAGRIFVAGDAAHSHPPYGGFGLNNGLEDAVNLSWKLAAALQGWGGDALLQSYDDERRPVFKEIAEHFIAARIREDGAFLDRFSPHRDRAEFERAWRAREDDIGSRVQDYEPNYEGSPAVWGPAGAVSGARGRHSLRARPGHHLGPLRLSSGRNVYEELGTGFTLLALDADNQTVAQFEQAAQSLAVPLTTVRDSFDGGRDVYESRLILVRPDQHIAWCGDLSDDAGAVMKRVAGR